MNKIFIALLVLLVLCLVANVSANDAKNATKSADADDAAATEEEEATIDDVLKEYLAQKEKKEFTIRQVSFEKPETTSKLIQFLASPQFESSKLIFSSLNDLSDAALKDILQNGVMKTGEKITHLGLAKIALGKDSCAVFAQVIATLPNLNKLQLYRNKLTLDCIKVLVNDGIAKAAKLFKIVSIENSWGDDGVAVLAAHIASANNKISELVLRDSKITSKGTKDIQAMLSNSKVLAKIDLSENPKIGNTGVADIIAGAKASSSLTHFELNYAELDAKSVPAFADLLRANKKLVRVDLSENELGDEGAELFAKLLAEKVVTLERLDLSSCEIEDKGAVALLEAMKLQQGVKELYLYRNEITNATIQESLKQAATFIKTEYANDTVPEASEDEAENLGEGLIDEDDGSSLGEADEEDDDEDVSDVQNKRAGAGDKEDEQFEETDDDGNAVAGDAGDEEEGGEDEDEKDDANVEGHSFLSKGNTKVKDEL